MSSEDISKQATNKDKPCVILLYKEARVVRLMETGHEVKVAKALGERICVSWMHFYLGSLKGSADGMEVTVAQGMCLRLQR